MSNFILWLAAILLFVSIVRVAIWLNAIDATLKRNRHMRTVIRNADVAELKSFGDGKIDLSEFETITLHLEQLGFQELGLLLGKTTFEHPSAPQLSPIVDPVQEIASESKIETDTTAIARIFANRHYGCYASIMSAISISKFDPSLQRSDLVKIAPFRTAILSVENLEPDAWGFANSNREVDPFMLLLRNPRKLSHRMIGATAEALLQAHLVERDDIAKRGGFEWSKKLSLENYRSMENATIDYIHLTTQTWEPISVAIHLLTYKFKNHDWWLGDLEKQEK